MINAAIVIPPDTSLDGAVARRCHDHLIQGDYRLVAVLRTWDQLDRAIQVHGIQVIVSDSGTVCPTDMDHT